MRKEIRILRNTHSCDQAYWELLQSWTRHPESADYALRESSESAAETYSGHLNTEHLNIAFVYSRPLYCLISHL